MIVWAPSPWHRTSGILIGVLVSVNRIVIRRVAVQCVEELYLDLGYCYILQVMDAVVHMFHMQLINVRRWGEKRKYSKRYADGQLVFHLVSRSK